jgi:DNA-binding transcriptional LysR family regulator
MIENFKLKVFRIVADTLNFRRAADELHLTQPAITSQIKSLEESLGIALFDRISRDIRLTLAGTTQYNELIKFTTALRPGTADAESILRRFTKNNVQHPTYKALCELDKALKTIFLCDYLRQ